MPEGNTLPGGQPRLMVNFQAVAPALHAPAVVQPAAPPVPMGSSTPIGGDAPAPDAPTPWVKYGILAAVGAAVVFLVAGRKKKR